jgi:hypothetical protein
LEALINRNERALVEPTEATVVSTEGVQSGLSESSHLAEPKELEFKEEEFTQKLQAEHDLQQSVKEEDVALFYEVVI